MASLSSSTTNNDFPCGYHEIPSGSNVALVRRRVPLSAPFFEATKGFRFFQKPVSCTSESEIKSFLSLGSYVSPVGSVVGVNQLDVCVLRPSCPCVALAVWTTATATSPIKATTKRCRRMALISLRPPLSRLLAGVKARQCLSIGSPDPSKVGPPCKP